MSEKIFGYTLIALGLTIAAFSLISVYRVFSGQAAPYGLFSFPPVAVPVSALVGESVPVSGEGTLEIMPAESINKTTNTFAHLFLMGFIASIGFKIAGIGTNLVRPIVVSIGGNRVEAFKMQNNGKA